MCEPDVIIIDYGMGNLLSVKRALEHIGACAIISADAGRIAKAKRIILPGVGAFPDAMTELTLRGLSSTIQDLAKNGTPILGICLGMQVLFETSVEYGNTQGLSILPGEIIPIPAVAENGIINKIPHIGWNALRPFNEWRWKKSLLAEIEAGESVYFAHSYMLSLVNSEYRIADCDYGGISIPAFISQNNIFACQFHPEKSGRIGIRILQKFMHV